MQKVRSHPALRPGSYRLYVHGFRFYFTPLPGFFSPFPHGTRSLSVDWEYPRLGGWPPHLHTRFHVPRATFGPCFATPFQIRDYHPLRSFFPKGSPKKRQSLWCRPRPVRSPLLRPSLSILFPRGTKMFQFPRFACSRSL